MPAYHVRVNLQLMEYIKKPELEHVRGDTWCIVTGFARIPIYLADRKRAIMIDSGLRKPDGEEILALLEREKIHVSSLLTSHYHQDHIGNHALLKARFQCEVYMSPYAAAVCAEPRNMLSGNHETYHIAQKRLASLACKTERVIDLSGNSLSVEGAEFGILHLPGHAQEQLGFVTPDGVAYLADTVLSEPIFKAIRLPYITYCTQDLQAKESLKALPYDCYLLAHNEVREEICTLAQKNIENIQEKLALIEGLADHWITMEQLTAKVIACLGGDAGSVGKVFGAKRNVQVFSEHLLERNRLAVRARDGLIEYIATK